MSRSFHASIDAANRKMQAAYRVRTLAERKKIKDDAAANLTASLARHDPVLEVYVSGIFARGMQAVRVFLPLWFANKGDLDKVLHSNSGTLQNVHDLRAEMESWREAHPSWKPMTEVIIIAGEPTMVSSCNSPIHAIDANPRKPDKWSACYLRAFDALTQLVPDVFRADDSMSGAPIDILSLC